MTLNKVAAALLVLSVWVSNPAFAQRVLTSAEITLAEPASAEELQAFSEMVGAENLDLWDKIFLVNQLQYLAPRLSVGPSAAHFGCGQAAASAAPLYCPDDETVYVDTSFHDQIRRQSGAGADGAMGFLIARQFAHGIQHLLHVDIGADNDEAAAAAEQKLRIGLQADCYAGIWSAWTAHRDLLGKEVVISVLSEYSMPIGTAVSPAGIPIPRGFQDPEFSLRQKWFSKGYNTASVGHCDAITGDAL